jgi:hypothetical protein
MHFTCISSFGTLLAILLLAMQLFRALVGTLVCQLFTVHRVHKGKPLLCPLVMVGPYQLFLLPDPILDGRLELELRGKQLLVEILEVGHLLSVSNEKGGKLPLKLSDCGSGAPGIPLRALQV